MKNKSFAVIGLGQFGMTLAVTLAESDCDVLAIDDKEENIEEISEKVTYAVKADVREPGILKALGVQNVDVAIIAVAENLEASISATMQAKDLGVSFVVAKSMNSLHGRILDKIGADKIIYPEQSMGLRVARNLMSGGYLDVFELSAEFSMAEFSMPVSWSGKNLVDLNVRERFHINIIGIKQGENVTVDLDPSEPLPDNCSIIAIGKNKDLNASREELR
nr:TrkA family potassium uptake protein [uncultured Blautia sp.]